MQMKTIFNWQSKMTVRKATNILRRNGYKMTPQRRILLERIMQSHEHFTPATLHERVSRDTPGIGLVTVYRTVELLSRLGLLCCVYGEGNNRSYVMRRPESHHHHLICSGCGKVVEFMDCDITGLEEKLSKRTGFRIENHFLEVRGICPACMDSVLSHAQGE
jgi:Fur family ferric uptake transcriptional regulator